MNTDENAPDWADRVGKHISAIFLALLAALFVCGYLGPYVAG